MIIELAISNFKSIREKVVFSMLASNDSSHEEELYDYNGNRILREAVIYGSNGSGKTNLIDSMAYFKYLVVNCGSFQEGNTIPRPYHKLSSNENTSIDIQFVFEKIKYAYGFSLNDTEIVEEYLYHFPEKRQAKIFDRKGNKYSFGTKYSKELSDYVSKSKSNKLFLNTAESWSSLVEIINPFIYIRDNIIVHLDGPDDWFEYSAIKIKEDEKMKLILIDFLKNMGLQVKDIEVKIDNDIEIPSHVKGILNQLQGISSSTKMRSIDVKFVYDGYSLSLNEESLGTNKLFRMICPIVDVLMNKKVLFYDELENSLHSAIVLQLIETFKKWDKTEGAQLIFTTHDTSLLDLNIFRRDQIWFSERNPLSLSSEYYSLTELRNVRKDENIKKGFITGRYSSIPLKNCCLNEILEG